MSNLKTSNPVDFFRFCPKCGYSSINKHSGKSIQCNNCGFLFFFNASGAVIALIFNEKDELLVTRRAFEPAKGTLDLPGGFIDPNESAEEALIREIKEELNLNVDNYEYLHSHPNQYPYSGIYVATVDLIYNAYVSDFSTLKVADDVSECIFVPRNRLDTALFGLKSVVRIIDIVKNDRRKR